MFLVFEGADGVGKSTQAALLAERLRSRCGYRTESLREPGGTPLGERVRDVLLDPESGDLSAETEMLLFMAARAHLLRKRILPALESGSVVVCDRFLWSSVVYQGIVGGLGAERVLAVGRLAGAPRPDWTCILDLPAASAAARLKGRDRMERKGRAFQERVRRGFLELARLHPRGVAVVNARGSPEEVHRRVVDALPRRGWPEQER